MRYSLKTGRLKFEAVDKMVVKTRTQKTKKRMKMPTLIIRRPATNEKTIESLNKNLSKHIITFNKRNQKFSITRLLGKSEIFNMIKRTAVYTTAACVMMVLVYGSFTSMDITFAKQVIANGSPVGIIKDVDAFEDKVLELETELDSLSEGKFDDHAKLVYITRICFEKDITPEKELMQNVMATYEDTALAYALYVDGVMVCASKEEADIKSVLDGYKMQYAVETEGAKIDFNQKVEIKNEYVPVAYLRSDEGILNAITQTQEEEIEYTVQDKDTVWDIATTYGMSVDEIMQINPEMTDFIKPGDKLKLNESEPILQVKVSYTETVQQAIPYENERINDSNLTKGRTEIISQGHDGVKEVTQEVVLVNGRQFAVNVVNETVIQEAVNGKVRVGTKIVSGVGSGSFMRPAYGTITARFGSGGRRWSSGRHTGLDIAARTGTPIYAADAGRVTFAGWKGSYGYLVILNHGNGYETYYGHCSKLLVSKGQVVSKGDQIAKVGNTGNSTGSHCHFEVRYNGSIKNPENYLR